MTSLGLALNFDSRSLRIAAAVPHRTRVVLLARDFRQLPWPDMGPARGRRLPQLVLAGVAALVPLSGCGEDDDDGASVPEGSDERTVETAEGTVAIAYPEDWGELERSEGDGTTIYAATSPEGDAFVELRVTEDTSASFEAASQVAAVSTAVNSGFAFEVDDVEAFDLDGAAAAERVTYRPGTLADDATGTLVAVFAETDAGTFISVGAGADPDVDADLEAIVDSLQVDE